MKHVDTLQVSVSDSYALLSGRADGTNRFKRWFWDEKITRTLHDNENEPWTQMPWAEGPITNFIGEFNGEVSQILYNMTAALGIEALKMVWLADDAFLFTIDLFLGMCSVSRLRCDMLSIGIDV